jgi:ATP-dependent DNA helicase RecG
MAIAVALITEPQREAILVKAESHFTDMKSKEIAPSKLSRTLSAFANADAGEVYIGISQKSDGSFIWDGFATIEDANQHIEIIERYFPIGQSSRFTFLLSEGNSSFVLHCEIEKTIDLSRASDGMVYLRRGAQNLKQETDEQINRIKLNKGILTFEDQTLQADITDITNSLCVINFMVDNIPTSEPENWLRKQKLITGANLPTAAGILLFSDEPQCILPKTSVKIYRYRTTAQFGTRETLAFDPKAVEGNTYNQIYDAVALVKQLTEAIPLLGEGGLEKIEYPTEAIHEIITNAVIHRDYSLKDDIHIRIFDNRIEVQSPGTLPAHVTVKNILDERAARNPKIVRLLNKFRNPPNKDVGEGLNTAFEAMKKLKLKEPIIEQKEYSLLVTLRHEKLGSPDQLIVDYLRDNHEINNAVARGLCSIGSENTVKRIFAKMVEAGVIERVPDRPLNKTGYVKGKNFPRE